MLSVDDKINYEYFPSMNKCLDLTNNNGWCNKKGTADRYPKSGISRTWKEYYIDHSDLGWPSTCRVFGCTNKAEVGAHMYRQDSADKSEYIVPLCSEHNLSKEKFRLKLNTELISANQSKV